MEYPQLNTGCLITDAMSFPQNAPTEFDLMFNEVQERMHRLFERYAELKRKKRPHRRDPFGYRQDTDCESDSCSSESGNRGTVKTDHENGPATPRSVCVDSTCSCNSSPRAAPTSAQPILFPLKNVDKRVIGSDGEDNACPFSSDGESSFRTPNSAQNCEICRREALEEGIKNGCLNGPTQVPHEVTAVDDRTLSPVGAANKNCKVPCNEPVGNQCVIEMLNERMARFLNDSDGCRPIGYQLTWKTPEKHADSCLSDDDSIYKDVVEKEVMEISCLPNDFHCLDDQAEQEIGSGQATPFGVCDGMGATNLPSHYRQPLSLQDAFYCNKMLFLRRCRERQCQIESKHEKRMKSDWVDRIPYGRENSRPKYRYTGNRARDSASNGCPMEDFGNGDGQRRQRVPRPCIAKDNVISLKIAREETNRRLLQIRPKKKKSPACLLEEARIRRYRLVAYSRMVRNRNHYLYDHHANRYR